jgi:hypothetical protein
MGWYRLVGWLAHSSSMTMPGAVLARHACAACVSAFGVVFMQPACVPLGVHVWRFPLFLHAGRARACEPGVWV